MTLGVLKIKCFDTLDVAFLGFLTIGVLKIRYFEVKLAAIDIEFNSGSAFTPHVFFANTPFKAGLIFFT